MYSRYTKGKVPIEKNADSYSKIFANRDALFKNQSIYPMSLKCSNELLNLCDSNDVNCWKKKINQFSRNCKSIIFKHMHCWSRLAIETQNNRCFKFNFIFAFQCKHKYCKPAINQLNSTCKAIVQARCIPSTIKSIQTDADNLSELPRLILLAHYNEDIRWVEHLRSDFPWLVYTGNQATRTISGIPGIRNTINLGLEAGKYLQFIVDNYDDLPLRTMFLHAHETSHHDVGPYWKKNARVESIMGWDWENSFFDFVAGDLTIFEQGVNIETIQQISIIWERLFLKYAGPLPQRWVLRKQAQFIAHRDAIRQRPKIFWEDLLKWMYGQLLVGQPEKSPWIMEHAWGLTFGVNRSIDIK